MSGSVLKIDIETAYPDFTLSLSETLALSGVTAIFGPSGSGKTTLLRAIAGLDMPDSGHIQHSEDIWFDRDGSIHVPAHRRGVGYVFQDSRLFAHLDVARNLDFADKRARKSQLDNSLYSLDDIIESFALAPLLSRRIEGLSGGEQKRVALARTLLSRPKMLCLDEPLSGLDRARKREILPFLEDLPTRFGIPCFYISHDVEEVVHLCDRVLVLSGGRVQAHGDMLDVMQDMDISPFTRSQDAQTIFEGCVSALDTDQHMMAVSLPGGQEMHVPAQARIENGARVRLCIRARDVILSTQPPEGLSIRNALAGRIETVSMDFTSAFADIKIHLESGEGTPVHLKARITRSACQDLGLKGGSSVYALIKSVSFEGRLG